MKTILVPTDFSMPAQAAIETAVELAKKTNAEVILVHVVDQPTTDSFHVEGEVLPFTDWEDKLFTLKLIEKAKSQLIQAAEKVGAAGVSVRQILRLGNPFHGIRTVSKDNDVDLIVIGARGHSKIDRMITGSNAEKVVRHSTCPVLTVHRSPILLRFESFVYATSLLDEEEAFSSVVVRLQELFNATLHVVWINTPADFQAEAAVKRTMKEFARRLRLKNFTLNVFSDFSVEQGIVNFADSIDAGLISMATHGRTGLSHLIAGSIAEDISSKSALPVITSVLPKY